MKRIAAASGHAASWMALSPSLIPRTWWMTALNVAINAYGGQKAAEALASLRTRPAERDSSPSTEPYIRARRATVRTTLRRSAALITLGAAGSGLALARSIQEQADISKRTGLHAEAARQQILGYVLGELGWLSLDGLSIASERIRRVITHRLHRALPFMPELVLGGLTTVLLAYTWRQMLLSAFHRIAHQAVLSDFARPSQVKRPTVPERSGSRYSLEPFSTLGYHGRSFVASGPLSERVAEVLHRITAKGSTDQEFPRTPIRVFIGRLGHTDLHAAAEAAVAELHRAGAFDRPALLLASNTGSGWLPTWSIGAFEYLLRGNCSTVAIQYSFADSWLAFLIFRDQAKNASKYLLEAIEEHVDTLPAKRRPKLYMAGESLGALGGHGPFTSLAEMRERISGALWTGTPRTTPIVKQLYRERHYLTTELRPQIGRGSAVRFVQKPKHIKETPFGGPYSRWDGARIIYAQHSSDPVVWWEPSLIYKRPDWLTEPRGKDVSPYLNWVPWITFWQLLTDMPRSVRLPGGHGHNYHREVVHYWNEILGTRLTKKDCNRIGDAIEEDLGAASGSLELTDPTVWRDLDNSSALRRAVHSLVSRISSRPAR